MERIKRAASTEEIVKALEQGGFDFNEQGWAKGHRPRILAIALVKSTAVFRRLPNGMFGLEGWYEPRAKKGRNGDSEPDSEKKLSGKAKATRKKRSKKSSAPVSAAEQGSGEGGA